MSDAEYFIRVGALVQSLETQTNRIPMPKRLIVERELKQMRHETEKRYLPLKDDYVNS